MKNFKALGFLLILTHASTFCSFSRFSQSITRLAFITSQRIRCVAKPIIARPLSSLAIGTTAYVTAAVCIGRRIDKETKANKELTKKLRQASEECNQATKQFNAKWEAEEAANLAIEARVSEGLYDAFITILSRLYEIRAKEGQESFLKKAATFATVNGLTIDQVKQSFSANRDHIAKRAEYALQEMQNNPDYKKRQKSASDLKQTIPHIQLLDTMVKELEELSAANSVSDTPAIK